MAEEKEREQAGRDPLGKDEQAILAKKKSLAKGSREEKPPTLTMNSLMDILTILLVFLLKSYSTDPVNVTISNDLDVPRSTTILAPEQTVAITVSKSALLVDNMMLTEIKDGKVDGSLKSPPNDGYIILPLNKILVDTIEKQRRIAAVNPAAGKSLGLVTIIMDGETPFRLLTDIMYTATRAEFNKFKFFVISNPEG